MKKSKMNKRLNKNNLFLKIKNMNKYNQIYKWKFVKYVYKNLRMLNY